MSFWDDECPARGATLTHSHWNECDPDGVHPHDDTGNEGNHHPSYMCCHCQMSAAMVEASNEAIAKRVQDMITPPAVQPLAEHEYMPSMVGRCTRKGCGRLASEHIQLEHVAGKECVVKHESINTQKSLSIGDGGLQWKVCPGCGDQIEPRMTLGGPQGKKDGIGRGWVSPRMWRRWENIHREQRPS